MAGKFKLNTVVEIGNLNTRKEGKEEEDKVLAIDVKLTAQVKRDTLDFFDENLFNFLFLDSGAIRNLMMGPITFTHEMEGYRLEIAGSTHYGVRVKKFVIQAIDGGEAYLTFQVSFKPSGDEVAQIAEYLQDELGINLEPENEELPL